MSSAINPELAQPSTPQAFEQSDRNPAVTSWGGTDAEGGQIAAPGPSESRVTKSGPARPVNLEKTNYGKSESSDSVENEAEREG